MKQDKELLHTQGEWRYDAKHKSICTGESYDHYCKTLIAQLNANMGDESIANANLIASAPTLLEENKRLLDSNRELVDALKPFANMFGELTEEKVRQGGKVYEYNKAFFTVADLYAAYNAINPIK